MSSMIEVLEQHLKQNIRGCMCGWAEIGKSHTVHVADELTKAGYGKLPAVSSPPATDCEQAGFSHTWVSHDLTGAVRCIGCGRISPQGRGKST